VPRTIRIVAAAVVAATLAFAPAAVPKPPTGYGGYQAEKLRNAVTVEGMQQHLQAFQDIATANGGTRSSGTPGYDASVAYVVEQLEDAGYDPIVQEFDFPFFVETAPAEFERISPNPRVYVVNDEFITMTYSGPGNTTALLQEVNNNQFPPGPTPSSSSAGCLASNFAGFVPGNVALIQRGTCNFAVKAANAQAAGASAVIIFNEGQPGRTDTLAGTLGTPDFTIPVIGTSFAIGQELHNLLAMGPVTVRVETVTMSEIRRTANVLADSRQGDPTRVVIQGSHLDSVFEGPGIQDNGTGSAYNLESAIQLAEQNIRPKNKIRFAFWGAEEFNLLGSQHYVNSLSDAEFAKIAANLNHDMIGSPNFVRFVYDGDGSDTPTAGPEGSGAIEQVFLDYFASVGLASDPTAFDGRSDYGPFIGRGAPAGGLFTGAEGIKTAEQAAVYGGTAGVAYDICYHQACDTIANVNNTGLDQMADAAATALVVVGDMKWPKTFKQVTKEEAKLRKEQQVFAGPDAQR
jgi:Zn-dependent M28 family amino/carboxypeptidase